MDLGVLGPIGEFICLNMPGNFTVLVKFIPQIVRSI